MKTVDHVRVHLDRWLNRHLHAIVAGEELFPEPLTVPLLPSTSKSALQKVGTPFNPGQRRGSLLSSPTG